MSISQYKWGVEQLPPRGQGFTIEVTVSGDETARTFALPLYNSGTFDCVVYWGDGTRSVVTAYNDADITHIYASDGVYRIQIRGECPGWNIPNLWTHRLKITDIIYWGDTEAFGGFQYLVYGFNNCANLKSSGPAGSKILAKNTLTSLQGIFRGCTNASFTTVQAGIFDNCIELAGQAFQSAFSGATKISSLPNDLFKYNVKVSTSAFYGCFYGCSALVAIPTDLFKYNVLATGSSIYQLFTACTSLTTVPNNLFRYLHSGINTGREVFSNCTNASLVIPADIFQYNVNITEWRGVFSTTRFTTLANDIFKYNVNSTSFHTALNSCTNLTTLPADLFKWNTAATSFYRVIYGCTALTTVSADLFKYNILATDFGGTAYNTVKLQQRTDIFYNPDDASGIKTATVHTAGSGYSVNDELTVTQGANTTGKVKVTGIDGSGGITSVEGIYLSQGTGYSVEDELAVSGGTGASAKINITAIGTLRFYNKTVGFSICFQLAAAFTGTQGTAPNLWDVDFGSGTATKTDCWKGHSVPSVDNYASIPDEWKGL